jgi:hypothetical protein
MTRAADILLKDGTPRIGLRLLSYVRLAMREGAPE